MNELPYIDNQEILKREFNRLITERKNNKSNSERKYSLSISERHQIWIKTNGKCHICGSLTDKDNFEADHVVSHSSGGTNQVENFLASCETCNNYRWHYSSDEIQWILKLGVWAKTKINHGDKLGNLIAKNFINKEIEREARRKIPRVGLK
jgi:5-methylcytosine-specific restriction endonuclease McrA